MYVKLSTKQLLTVSLDRSKRCFSHTHTHTRFVAFTRRQVGPVGGREERGSSWKLSFSKESSCRFVSSNTRLCPASATRAGEREGLQGDSYGRYTYSSSLGSSTVDYFITDQNPESLRASSQSTDSPIRSQQNYTT